MLISTLLAGTSTGGLSISSTSQISSQYLGATALIRKKGGAIYPPSLTTCFQDSACSIPAVVDGVVGGVVDGSGYLGPELNTLGGMLSSGAVRTMKNGAAPGDAFVIRNAPNGLSWHDTVGVVSLGGKTSQYVVIRAGGNVLNLYQATGTPLDISAVSVKQVNPIETQGTSGYRPILRKGAVNLLLNSNNFAAWSNVTTTCTPNATGDPFGGNNAWSISNPVNNNKVISVGVLSGITYYLTFYIKKLGQSTVGWEFVTAYSEQNNYNFDTDTLAGTNLTRTLLTNGWVRIQKIITPVTSGILNIYIYGSQGYYFSGSAYWYQVSISTSSDTNQAVTTTAPASNGVGNYWLDFDGVDDYLQLSRVPFQLADDSFACVAVKSTASIQRSIISSGDVTTTNSFFEIGYNSTQQARGVYKDNLAIQDSPISAVASTEGVSEVISAVKTGDSKKIRRNGINYSSASTALTPYNWTGTHIGQRYVGGAVQQRYKGGIYAICIIKGTLTDKEALLIEKYIAKLTDGVTI